MAGVLAQVVRLSGETEPESLLLVPPRLPPHRMNGLIVEDRGIRGDWQEITQVAAKHDLGGRQTYLRVGCVAVLEQAGCRRLRVDASVTVGMRGEETFHGLNCHLRSPIRLGVVRG